MLRRVAAWVLKLVTCTIPVFIAACYGVPYRVAPCAGKVVDKSTKAGIGGIEVICMSGGDGLDVQRTAADGSFVLQVPVGSMCESIEAADVDGATNGSYATASVTPASCDVTIELDPA